MIKTLSMVVLVAACGGGGGDKCAKVYDKMAPMFEKMGGAGKKPDRDKMVGDCKAKIKEHPDREAEMDCILAIDGEITMEKLLACDKKVSAENPGAKGGFKDYQDRSKATEAKLQLNKIGKLAKVAAAEKGLFPAGSAPLTPATDCCKGSGGKCAVDANAWKVVPWSTLEFEIDEPHIFRYSYEGAADGKSFTATAVGDLDCSGKTQTYTMKGTIDASGNPTTAMQEP